MKNSIFQPYRRSAIALVLLAGFSSNVVYAEVIPPISGRLLTQEQILPADVLSRVEWVRREMRLIANELGKPKIALTDITITGAAPREVYYWAATLYRKADRLAFELAGTRGTELHDVEATALRPFHVWQYVDQALQRIHAVKARLNIPEIIPEIQLSEDTTPSDVFEALAQASHEINQLLTQRIAPADVFQQVTVSVNTMAQLLATFPRSTRIPDEPKFVRRKEPGNVYSRLLGCYDLLSEIAQRSNLQVLKFSVSAKSRAVRTPSDVYDLASLIVSELTYFHDQLAKAESPAKAYHPGYKMPSHVFQRVGILEAQLESLLDYVGKQPRWLKS